MVEKNAQNNILVIRWLTALYIIKLKKVKKNRRKIWWNQKVVVPLQCQKGESSERQIDMVI